MFYLFFIIMHVKCRMVLTVRMLRQCCGKCCVEAAVCGGGGARGAARYGGGAGGDGPRRNDSTRSELSGDERAPDPAGDIELCREMEGGSRGENTELCREMSNCSGGGGEGEGGGFCSGSHDGSETKNL